MHEIKVKSRLECGGDNVEALGEESARLLDSGEELFPFLNFAFVLCELGCYRFEPFLVDLKLAGGLGPAKNSGTGDL